MIKEIEIGKLRNHPKNVRKTYSDIEELADSIRKKGILQNLTVVPDPEAGEEERYLVVIGNRRLQAASMACLASLPCSVVEMTEQEQVETMLLENLQRNDLTPVEEAEGFQYMLDLGETEQSIAEKTGFSRTTVRHRLKIAELDRKALLKRQEDKQFQLTLTDLYELEKIRDLGERNRLLREASSGPDFRWKVQAAVEEQDRSEARKKIIEELKRQGVKMLPKNMESERYGKKLDRIADYTVRGSAVPEPKIPKKHAGRELWFYESRWGVEVYAKAKKEEKPKPTKAELERADQEKRRKQLKEILKRMRLERQAVIRKIGKGMERQQLVPMDEALTRAWDAITMTYSGVDVWTMARNMVGDDNAYYGMPDEERKKLVGDIRKKPLLTQMVLALYSRDPDIVGYFAEYKPKDGETLAAVYTVLAEFGYTPDDEALRVISGTHELYTREEKSEEGPEEEPDGVDDE